MSHYFLVNSKRPGSLNYDQNCWYAPGLVTANFYLSWFVPRYMSPSFQTGARDRIKLKGALKTFLILSVLDVNSFYGILVTQKSKNMLVQPPFSY